MSADPTFAGHSTDAHRPNIFAMTVQALQLWAQFFQYQATLARMTPIIYRYFHSNQQKFIMGKIISIIRSAAKWHAEGPENGILRAL